jgi:hypothetical protein
MDNEQFFYDEDTHEFKVNVVNWQTVTIIKYFPSLVIGVDFKLYRLLDSDITFQQFHQMVEAVRHGNFYIPVEAIGVTMPCSKCGGNRKLDWIEAVMGPTNGFPMVCRRNPNVGILKFNVLMKTIPILLDDKLKPSHSLTIDDWNDVSKTTIVYSSLPRLEDFKEYCPQCYGTGMRDLNVKDAKLVKVIK